MRLPHLFSSAEVSSALKTPRRASNLDENRLPTELYLWRARYFVAKAIGMLRDLGESAGNS